MNKYKCLACGESWERNQLFVDPTTIDHRLTCGNLFCGGTVVTIKPQESTLFGEHDNPQINDDLDETSNDQLADQD